MAKTELYIDAPLDTRIDSLDFGEKRIQMVIDEAFKRDTPARDAFYQAVDKEMTKQKGFSR